MTIINLNGNDIAATWKMRRNGSSSREKRITKERKKSLQWNAKITMKWKDRFPLKCEIFFKIISIYKYELTDDGDFLSYEECDLYRIEKYVSCWYSGKIWMSRIGKLD